MKTLSFLLLAAIAVSSLTSCETDNDELRWKLDRKNQKYLDRQERWKMRGQARQERTDAWFDRVMN
jgi:hypothetical protein